MMSITGFVLRLALGAVVMRVRETVKPQSVYVQSLERKIKKLISESQPILLTFPFMFDISARF